MKKLLALILILLMALCVVGCKSEMVLYVDTDLDDYVELADYDEISVNLSDDDFSNYYKEEMLKQLSKSNAIAKISDGYVELGNTVNIDYVGKVDGKIYSGGNVSNYDLVMGQGQLDSIPGFEEAIVGKEIGEVVEVDLTFPSDYKRANLAGKAVHFTIKINYVADENPIAQNYYTKLGYASVKECDRAIIEAAVKECLFAKVVADSKKEGYPEEMVEKLYELERALLDKAMMAQTGKDFSTYLSSVGQSEEEYKKNLIENKIKPSMDTQMIVYAMLDDMDLSVSKDEITARAQEIADATSNTGDTVESILSSYGEHYFEDLIATEKVKERLFETAKFDESSKEYIDKYLDE